MILQRLKHEIEPYHRDVESRLDLVSPRLTRGRYRTVLAQLSGFYLPWQRQLTACSCWGAIPTLAARLRGSALVEDLRALGVESQARLPQCAFIPQPTSLPALLGTMYVFEGATLGGRIVSQHVERTLALQGAGCSFFTAYGDQVIPMWRAFQELLVSHSGHCGDDKMIAAARDTFQALAAWLREPFTQLEGWGHAG
jgi:heme oxygenase